MSATKQAIQKLATMGSLPASLQSMLEAALREDEARKFCDCNQGRMPCTCKPAEQHQGEVVGWQFYQQGKWWNGDDRIKDHRKNTEAAGIATRDVYTHADPAEVERLRNAVEFYCKLSNEVIGERDTLRAQLAEAHALLQKTAGEVRQYAGDYSSDHAEHWRLHGLADEAQALSASAEPSAPRFEAIWHCDTSKSHVKAAFEAEPSAPVNPCMSAANFVEQYSKASGLSVREFYDEQVPMPDPTSPSGWAAVSNSPISIKAHVDTRLAEPTGGRRYYCGKVKVVLGHGSYAICGQLGPGGETLQCEDCATMERKP